MIPVDYQGGTPAGVPAQQAQQPTKTSIWDDPNLLAIMLGQMGQAVMGEHQGSWQAQMGKAATGLGQSSKMADVTARREAERKEERDYWRKLVEGMSGLHTPSEMEMSLGDMSEPSGMMMG